MRGQCPKIATSRAQEKSDRNFMEFQYYAFFRGVLHQESSYEFIQQDFGFIKPAAPAAAATLSAVFDNCTKTKSIIPDEKTTTSFVCAWKDYGMLYQTVKFDFMPDLRIEEFIFCDAVKEQIHCVVRFETAAADYTYTACQLDQLTPLETYRNHLEDIVCGDKNQIIYTCFNLARNTVLTSKIDNQTALLLTNDSIPQFSAFIKTKILPSAIHLERVLGFMIVNADDVILAAPINDKTSLYTCRSNRITLNNNHTIVFDEKSNQYLLS